MALKHAVAKAWNINPSADGKRWSAWPGGDKPGATFGEQPPISTTNHRYVRQGATGTGSGLDWTNAYASLPATLTRDTTYWVADGSYGGYVFDDALSGTNIIQLRKATANYHGTETGWSAAYGDGVATFGTLNLFRGYIVLDGAVRSSDWSVISSYGFRINRIDSNTDNGEDGSNSKFRCCCIGQSDSAAYVGVSEALYLTYTQHHIEISRCHLRQGSPTTFQGAGAHDILVEYTWVGDGYGKQAIRGGNFNPGYNWTIRHSVFFRSSQTDPNDGSSGITADIAIWDYSVAGGLDNNQVYGNVFWNDRTGGRNSCVVIGGNGSNWAGVAANNCKIFNNTLCAFPEAGAYPLLLINGGTGNEVRNNLAFGIAAASLTVSANAVSNNVKASADPFINYAGLDFRITAGSQAKDAGISLGGNPFNLDQAGNLRGADGTWDIGAFEYDATEARYALSFPLNSSFSPNDGTSNTGNMTALVFANPHTNGFNVWGANNTAGATVLVEYHPLQQPGFYAPPLWYSDNDSFNVGTQPYWGSAGLFPQNNSNLGTAHWWEGATDGTDTMDYLGRQYSDGTATPTVAVKGQWYTTGVRVTRNNANSKSLVWYRNLPAVDDASRIQYTTTTTGYGETPPSQPQLTIGDSPWYASFQHESVGGYIGRMKIFAGVLSQADMLAEAADMTRIVTVDGQAKIWWFKPGFRSVDDLQCEAGTGHTFAWFDNTKKATLVALP